MSWVIEIAIGLVAMHVRRCVEFEQSSSTSPFKMFSEPAIARVRSLRNRGHRSGADWLHCVDR